jgi:hypothetical protein
MLKGQSGARGERAREKIAVFYFSALNFLNLLDFLNPYGDKSFELRV